MKEILEKRTPKEGGILLVNKQQGTLSFQLVTLLRKITQISKIGHSGTLDPFATGVMVMLIGKKYTQQSQPLSQLNKQYLANVRLGTTTDSHDVDGAIISTSTYIPSIDQIHEALTNFQGEILQTPPMFSAKKVGGKKLYDLARKGITIERNPKKVTMEVTLVKYMYPDLWIRICCSSGTYVRVIGHELGEILQCGAYVHSLVREKVGPYPLENCIAQENVTSHSIAEHITTL